MNAMKKLRLLLIALALMLAPLYSAHSFTQTEDPGGIGGCVVSNCLTTCTGPTGAECCCDYQCPSGFEYVCKSGYCPGTSRSCGH